MMIEKILDTASNDRCLTPSLFKLIHKLRAVSMPDLKELTEQQYTYACHSLHLNPCDVIARVDSMANYFKELDKSVIQRIAIIEELKLKTDIDSKEFISILIEPMALFNLSTQGVELYHKRRKWRTEYPGTELWLKQIKEELSFE